MKHMFMRYLLAFSIVVAALGASVALSANAHAAQPSCSGVATSIISCDNTENGVLAILLLAINILSAGIGIVAVGGIIYAAILWTTAEDKAAQITQSKTTIFNIILGLVAYALLFAFVQFLVPGGVFNRDLDLKGPSPATMPVSEGNDNDSPGNENKNKKAYIRIGVYNVKSVNESSTSQLKRFKVGWARIKDSTDIVVAVEFSTTLYQYISANFPDWRVYYPQNSRGDRGKAILYKKDKFSASNASTLALPLISTANRSVKTYAPSLTLTRKKDKASVSILAVHLAAINGNVTRWVQNQKDQQPAVGRWLSGGRDNTRVAAGDFNWYFPGRSSNLTGIQMRHKGERVMRLMIPQTQKFGGFYRVIDANGISDHPQIIGEVETTAK